MSGIIGGAGSRSGVIGTTANLGAVTTADINGGTIDATTIGASSETTGKFTDCEVTGDLNASGRPARIINWNDWVVVAYGATVSHTCRAVSGIINIYSESTINTLINRSETYAQAGSYNTFGFTSLRGQAGYTDDMAFTIAKTADNVFTFTNLGGPGAGHAARVNISYFGY